MNETPKCDKNKSKGEKIGRRHNNFIDDYYGDGPTPYDYGYGYNSDNAFNDIEYERYLMHRARRNPKKDIENNIDDYLGESQLRNIVNESIKKVLNEDIS